jgi:tetratricopeptide (TPR) repeat protein
MMNAQVSFPYQLPVPLVIMPFFVSLIIRGSENIEQNTFSIPLKPWFNKTATALSGLVFAFILINDLAWMRDIHVMNRIVAMKEPPRPWKPVNPIFSQGYITGGRSIIETLQAADRPRLSLYIAEPLLEYWPDTSTDAMLVARSHLNLKQYEEAEYWFKRAIASQPEGDYTGDIYLAELYLERNQTDDLRELYNTMKEEPEELLRSRGINYRFLHTASINVNDYEMTTYFYDKYMEYFSEYSRHLHRVIANHAVFYLNTGRTAEAVPYIKRTLELRPNHPLRDTFNEILAQFPGQ